MSVLQETSWQPTGAWKRAFREALNLAFDDGALELLTSDYLPPASLFSRIAPPGINKTFELRLNELIENARMNDWLIDLVAAVRERRPKNKKLADIAAGLGLTATGTRLDNPTGLALEALVQSRARFITPGQFIERLARLEGQVCWVDIPGGGGTGFLVGADLVLTNQHVIQRLANGAASWRDVVCRFDYRQAFDGSVPVLKKPTEVRLGGAEWLVDSKPPSPSDNDPLLAEARADEADYAILRLESAIGDSPVGGDTADPQAQPRGWVSTAETPPLTRGDQIFLLQHPQGEPQRLTIGTVKEFNQSATRVRYDANSRKGSSGSPCFDADLRLVALHHAQDPSLPPQWNQAVPVGVLKQSWTLA